MTVQLRNLTDITQTVTVVLGDFTYIRTVYSLNYLVLSDSDYAAITPPLVLTDWEVVFNPPPIPPPPPPVIPDTPTTDALPEGVTNLYFTNLRALNAVAPSLASKADDGLNLGTGLGIFKQMSGSVMQFRAIKAGANMTIGIIGDDITFATAGGVSSLNGLGNTSQTFATGTTGSDFNIVSSLGVHTFNIPDASTTARGLLSVGAQDIAGNKNFLGAVGIGTTTPNAKLHVVDASTNYQVRVSGGSTASPGIQFYNSGAGVGRRNWAINTEFNTIGGLELLRSTSAGGLPTTNVITFDNSGNVGINTLAPTTLLDVNGDTLRLRNAKTPATSSDAGDQGSITWDANFIYVCVATNSWKRVALTTF